MSWMELAMRRLVVGLLIVYGAMVSAAPVQVSTRHAADDMVIAEVVFKDWLPGVDASAALQKTIEDLASRGGGTIFLPAGRIRLDKQIIVKEGVVLRGDNPKVPYALDVVHDVGTVLELRFGRGDADGEPAILVERGTGLRELVFWYPEQSATQPVPYSWTVSSRPKVAGDNYTLINCLFVNPYRGVRFGPHGNELHTLRSVTIFPYEIGIQVDSTTDIGRLDHVVVQSPAYASSSCPQFGNLSGADVSKIASVGLDFGRSDWEYFRDIMIRGMKTGVRFRRGIRGTTNAVMSYTTILDAETALDLGGVNGVGISLYECRLEGRKHALRANADFTTASQFHSCVFVSREGSDVLLEGKGILTFENCRFEGTRIDASVGDVVFTHCSGAEGMVVQVADSVDFAEILGGTLCERPVRNAGKGNHVVAKPVDGAFRPIARRDVRTVERQSRKAEKLLVVTDFGASPELEDNGPAFQKALDSARGGGRWNVYVPAGMYRFRTNLRIPTGVELRGSFDVPHHTVSGGSVLMPMQGKGDESGEPFIVMESDSGLRGFTVWYPEQSNLEPVQYPWTVQSRGTDCSIVDVTIGNAWQAVDFMTYPSTGHYIEYLAGAMLRRGLFVGKSSHGSVLDVQFNPHYASRLHAGLPSRKQWSSRDIIEYQRDHLEGIVFDDVQNERVVGTFLYAARDGIAFYGESDATVLMHGTDTAYNGALMGCDSPTSRVDFALAQLVPLGKKPIAGIVTSPSFKGTVYFVNSQLWAGPATALLDGSGTVVLDQLNTCTGAIFVNNGTCHFVNNHFTKGGLKPHVKIGEGAKRVTMLATSTIKAAVQLDIAKGVDALACGNMPTLLRGWQTFTKRGANLSVDFESEVPSFKPDTVAQVGGGVRDVSTYSCKIVERDDAHSGKRVLEFKGKPDHSKYCFVYCDVLKGPFEVTPDTVFRYWVKPSSKQSQCTGLDIRFTNGNVKRDMGISDIQGRRSHVAAAGTQVGEWTEVVIELGKSKACGMTIDKIMVAYDTRNGGEPFEVLIDDVSLSSPLPLELWSVQQLPKSGTYPSGTRIALPTIEDMALHYTLDGTNPTVSSPRYTEPVLLPGGYVEIRSSYFDKNGVPFPFIFSGNYVIEP